MAAAAAVGAAAASAAVAAAAAASATGAAAASATGAAAASATGAAAAEVEAGVPFASAEGSVTFTSCCRFRGVFDRFRGRGRACRSENREREEEEAKQKASQASSPFRSQAKKKMPLKHLRSIRPFCFAVWLPTNGLLQYWYLSHNCDVGPTKERAEPRGFGSNGSDRFVRSPKPTDGRKKLTLALATTTARGRCCCCCFALSGRLAVAAPRAEAAKADCIGGRGRGGDARRKRETKVGCSDSRRQKKE